MFAQNHCRNILCIFGKNKFKLLYCLFKVSNKGTKAPVGCWHCDCSTRSQGHWRDNWIRMYYSYPHLRFEFSSNLTCMLTNTCILHMLSTWWGVLH